MSNLKKVSGVADGAGVVAHEFDTYDPLVNATARLMTIANDGTVKFDLWQSGYAILSGHLKINADGIANGGGTLTIGNAAINSSQGINFQTSSQARIEAGTALLHFRTATGGGERISVSPQANVDDALDVFAVHNDSGNEVLFLVRGSGDIETLTGRWESQVADGASAVALNLSTANTMSTDGATIFLLDNNGDAVLDVKVGTNLEGGYSTGFLFHFHNDAGNVALERMCVDDSDDNIVYDQFPVASAGYCQHTEIISDDFSQGTGHTTVWDDNYVSAHATAGVAGKEIICQRDQYSSSQLRLDSRNTSSDAGLRASQHLSATAAEFKVHGFDQSLLGLSDARWEFKAGSSTYLMVIGHAGDVALAIGSLKSNVADGASAIGFTLDTNNAFSTSGALLFSVQNNSSEKFAVDKDGKVLIQGTQVLTTQQSAVADAAAVTTVGSNTGTSGAGLSLIGDTSSSDQSGPIMNDLVALQEDVTELRTQLNAALAALRAHGIIAT